MADIILNGKNDGDGIRMSWSKAAFIVGSLIACGMFVGRIEGRMSRQDELIGAQTTAIRILTDKVVELTTAVEVLKVAPPAVDSQGRIKK